uniref:Putative inhibitor of growth protein 3 n=1 Tax=Amblyomma triste TaxID=251400 RepID=A0A023GIT4_AMBTT
MLYLEDYLEMIEHLPQELRDRFTEMREMDLQVQNAMDSLDERVKQFFANARKMKPEQRDLDFDKIRKDYYKALEDADEKVQIANQIYDLVDRYLRRLDQELQKFKMELEADNAGITEILERRSLELDKPPPSSVKAEKRKHVATSLGGSSMSGSGQQPEKRQATERVLPLAGEVSGGRPMAAAVGAAAAGSAALAPADRLLIPPSALTYGLGSNAIAAAASQAIAATQQMQQGRRTASLKASYEAINASLQSLTSREFTMGSKDIGSLTSLTPPPAPTPPQVMANPTPAAAVVVPPAAAPEPKRSSSKKQGRASSQQQQQPALAPASEDSGDSLLLRGRGYR